MEEIPLNPISKEEVHRLESLLLFATLFRPEVIEIIRNPAERLTWVDSLAVAAGAIAREKARMSLSEIANELGRTEQSLRKHLKGETKAGQLVRETYELIKQGKLSEILSLLEKFEESTKLKDEVEKLRAQREEFDRKIAELEKLKSELEEVQRRIEGVKKEIEKFLSA